MNIVNRKAHYEYTILEEYTAGIVLQGSEVKSIKAGKCNISDSYCIVNNGELWCKNWHISKYDSDKFTNHEELRDKKLLLTKQEINKLFNETLNPGITIIPLKVFVNCGLIKMTIGLCKGKKTYDKRNDIKERDNQRELDKIMKNY